MEPLYIFGGLVGAVVLVLGGWALRKYYEAHATSEKAVALKLGISAVEKLSRLQTPDSEAVAAAVATKAHEAQLLASFKEVVSRLQ